MVHVCHEITMGGKRTIVVKHSEILQSWIRRATDQNVLLGRAAAIEAEFSGWLTLLGPHEDRESINELHRLVAIHGRNLGLQKRPASAALRQIICLKEALEEVLGTLDHGLLQQIHTLMMITSDGHFLGHSEQLELAWVLKCRDFTPVIKTSNNTILTFLLVPLAAQVLDACYGRAMKMVGMHGATRLIIDVTDAEELDARFFDTTKALRKSRELEGVELIMTGIDPDSSSGKRLVALATQGSVLWVKSDLQQVMAPPPQ
jgi:hypothetical protein